MTTSIVTPRYVADARRALSHVERLCACGDRFAGQPGDRPAADYVEQCLSSYALQTERIPAELVTFRERACDLTLADGSDLDAVAAYYSPSTPGPLRAPLTYVGSESLDSFDGMPVEGRILVLEETALGYDLFWLGKLCELAATRGAVGVVVIHPFPWSYRVSLEFGAFSLDERFAEPSVPAVAISAPSALKLVAALARGEDTVTFNVETDNAPCISDHVVGTLRGTARPEERIVLLAHRDIPIEPGANDNGSGTATILEVARMLCNTPLACSVDFVSMAGEEGRAEGTAKYIEGL
ncbi:MAG: M28 family peptidase, partial [Solirubrobacteraceae bacterium]